MDDLKAEVDKAHAETEQLSGKAQENGDLLHME